MTRVTFFTRGLSLLRVSFFHGKIRVSFAFGSYEFCFFIVGNAAAHEDDSEGEEASALEEELSLFDPSAPARALNALNALRKSRQHYDVLLVAGGVEIAAHRAVLAAASPYLLETLAAPAPAPSPPAPAPTYRVEDVDPEALREIVEYAYTGKFYPLSIIWDIYTGIFRQRTRSRDLPIAETPPV